MSHNHHVHSCCTAGHNHSKKTFARSVKRKGSPRCSIDYFLTN
ncbi:MAG: hypothetical protein ACRCY4_01630 [Brevinema sp.]